MAFQQATKQRGLTLLELMMVVAIMGMILAVVIASFSGTRDQLTLEGSAQEVLTLLSQARGDTLSAVGGFQYGVHFDPSQAVLYRGPTYSSVDSTNKVVTIPPQIEIAPISIGGGSEVVFAPITGKTTQTGTVTVRVKSDTTKQRVITIEGTGVVSGS